MKYDLGTMVSRIEIEELKARYFVTWTRKTGAASVRSIPDGALFVACGATHAGGDAVVAFIRGRLGPDVTSVHHERMREITVDGPRATAIWAMQDRITRQDGTGFSGNRHYFDDSSATPPGSASSLEAS